MAEQNNKLGPTTLHGNRAKIDPNNKDPLFCRSYEAKSQPQTYDFDSLPGSPDDLKKARSEYKNQKPNQ